MLFLLIAGEATDTTKAISKLERFAVKYADDAPKVLDAITKASKLFPESEKVVPALANVLPSSALDNLVNAVKSGENMTASDYNKIVDLCKAAGKNVDEIEGATKFRSFRALKKHLGDPGTNKQWHHIVEQCQAKKRRSAFDIKEINSVANVRATPKEVHKEISRYYSSHQPFAEEGKTVRDWLNGQSYEKQYEFGLEQCEKFMKQYGYSID